MNDRAALIEFEPDRDEQLEEMATTGRGPRRLAAAALLAADHRRAARRGRLPGHDRPPRAARHERPAAPARTPAPLAPPAPPSPAAGASPAPAAGAPAATTPPNAKPKPKPATRRTPARTKPTAGAGEAPLRLPAPSPSARQVTPERLRRARKVQQHQVLRQAEPGERIADDEAWNRWASNPLPPDPEASLEKLDQLRTTDQFSLQALQQRLAGRRRRDQRPADRTERTERTKRTKAQRQRPALRARLSQAIDRMAEREVAMSDRIEQAIKPRSRLSRLD